MMAKTKKLSGACGLAGVIDLVEAQHRPGAPALAKGITRIKDFRKAAK